MAAFEKDLSQGSVAKQLILFSAPFLLSNLIQSLYNVADMIIVGQFCGTASLSGVNIGGQMTMIITNMVMGLCMGGTVLIGQYMGAKDRKSLMETVSTLFTAMALLAVLITVVMQSLRTTILALIQTPAESFSEANSYFLITMTGTIFIFGYNALAAVMRGLGDSKRPLMFVAIACAVNVFLDLLLVGLFGMEAAGAALATVASQGISMLLCILYLKKNNFMFDFKLRSFTLIPKRIKMILRIGVPTSVQNAVVGISFLFLTSLVNGFGVTASAAVGVVGKLNSFGILPAVAMSSSVAAMSAQNFGSGNVKRAVHTMLVGMGIACCVTYTIFAFVNLFPRTCLLMFGNNEQVIEQGIIYLRSFSFDYLIVPFTFCLNGFFIGSGHSLISLVNATVASLLVRIPACYVLGIVLDLGLRGVGAGAPCATLAAALCGLTFFVSGRWKKRMIVGAPSVAD